MNKTSIEWVKNPDGSQGYTWNPITGCLNHVNGMCKGGNFPCYAYKLANGRLRRIYNANKNLAPLAQETLSAGFDPFYPRFWLEKVKEPYQHRKPMGIFACDMSDWCGIGVPYEWSVAIPEAAENCPQHRIYTLTKQPQNLIKFSPFPDNCWVGVTATNAETFYDAVSELSRIQAKVKFLSFEPLLGDIGSDSFILAKYFIDYGINWIVCGSQTKPYKPPKIEWVREIVEAADRADVPVFLKDNLKPLLMDINQEYVLHSWAKHQYGYTGLLRQEMPVEVKKDD